jgi:hypothetical protein
MLILSEVKSDKVYLNITTGNVATGREIIEKNLSEEALENWVDKDDIGKGRKFDTGKPQHSLVPSSELTDVVKVFTMGADKYGRENWKRVEDGMFRYFDAMQRHIASYKVYMETGDERHLYDEESGLHHLSHAMTNALFLMWLDNNDAHKFAPENKPDWKK